MSKNEPFNLGHGAIIRETDLAFLFEFEDGKQQWIPKSCLHDDSEAYDLRTADEGKVVVQRWWAEKEGLEEA